MDTEVWKPVVGYEGFYEVSDLAHVRRLTPVRQFPAPHLIKSVLLSRTKRRVVNLSSYGTSRTTLLASVVAEAFIGPRPAGHVIHHIDGDSTNDAAANLSYLHRSDNRLLNKGAA